MSVISPDRSRFKARKKNTVLEPTYTCKLFLTSFSPHIHEGLFRASMTAWPCDAESDKLISKSQRYERKKKKMRKRKREQLKVKDDTSGASEKNEGERGRYRENRDEMRKRQ